MLEYLLTRHRWVFVCFFLLPVSAVYRLFFYLRNRIIFWLSSAPKRHPARVRNIQSQLRQWKAEGAKTFLCTARAGWLTMSIKTAKYKETYRKIAVNLYDILAIDQARKVVRVEPLATMGQVTEALIPLGWTLPVVPELDDLTIGGLIMGCGVETSSHKYGLFQHICVSFELVLADGSIVNCSEDDNPDIFHAIPWSHGTIGFLVSAEIRMVKASQYVKLKYIPVCDRQSMLETVQRESQDTVGNDFVECLVFSRTSGVVMTGQFANTCDPQKVNVLGRFWKPWFFKHVECYLHQGTEEIEYIPLRDYYHRHTKSIFWELQDIIPFGNNPLFRYLFGWLVPPPISLLKLTQTDTTKRLYELNHIVQDVLVPMNKLDDALTLLDKEIQLYPLWICPFKLFAVSGFVHPAKEKDELYVDIGAYGSPKVKPFIAKECIRKIELFVRQTHGFQMLYGDTYMTRDEFHEMFDHSMYNVIRRKLDCEKAFPEVYDKVCKAARM